MDWLIYHQSVSSEGNQIRKKKAKDINHLVCGHVNLEEADNEIIERHHIKQKVVQSQ